MRIYYLDYLRTALIFLVVVLHASLAYTFILPDVIPWWVKAPGLPVFDYIVVILDIFLMPIMFYIAGYFTLPSLQKRTALQFIKDKFLHILLPFILGVLLLNAYPDYVMAKTTQGYFSYWFENFLPNILTIDTHAKATAHLWFLSFLFGFYMITLVIHPLFRFSTKISYKTFLAIALLSFFGFLTINLIVPDYQPWRNYMYLFTIQRTRIPLYFLYFILGILVRKHGWSFGRMKLFLPLAILFASCDALLVVKSYTELSSNLGWKIAHAFFHNGALFTIFMTLMALFEKLNGPSVFFERLSTNSYAVYIIHHNIVLFLQLHLLSSNLAIAAKWVVVILASYLASNLISEYVLKKTPFVRKMLY